jgi:hypothetical protein
MQQIVVENISDVHTDVDCRIVLLQSEIVIIGGNESCQKIIDHVSGGHDSRGLDCTSELKNTGNVGQTTNFSSAHILRHESPVRSSIEESLPLSANCNVFALQTYNAYEESTSTEQSGVPPDTPTLVHQNKISATEHRASIQQACPICLEPLSTDPALLSTSSRQAASAVLEALRLANTASLSSSEPAAASTQHRRRSSSRSLGAAAAAALTPCGHLFHAACITEAMTCSFAHSTSPQCPLCRAALVPSAWWAWETAPGPGWLVLARAARRTGEEGRRAVQGTRNEWLVLCLRMCFRLVVLALLGMLVGLLVIMIRLS